MSSGLAAQRLSSLRGGRVNAGDDAPHIAGTFVRFKHRVGVQRPVRVAMPTEQRIVKITQLINVAARKKAFPVVEGCAAPGPVILAHMTIVRYFELQISLQVIEPVLDKILILDDVEPLRMLIQKVQVAQIHGRTWRHLRSKYGVKLLEHVQKGNR